MSKGYSNILKIMGITLAVYLGMRYILPVVIPFLVAWLLVRLVMPWCVRIQKKLRIKKEISGIFLLTLAVGLLAVAVYFIGSRLIEQICNFAAHLDVYAAQAQHFVNHCCRVVERNTGIHAQQVQKFVYDNMTAVETRIRTYTVPGVLKNSISYFMSAMKWMGAVLVIFVSVVLLLKDYDNLREKIAAYPFYEHMCRIAGAMQSLGGAWLKAQLLIILIVTVVCVAGLWLLRYPYALLMGIVIGLMDALPFIGTGTVLIPWAVYLMFTGQLSYGACLLVIFGVTNALREYLEPKLIGDKIGVYPIAMVAAVYVGIYVFGVSGVLLGPVSLMLIFEIYRECGI